MTSLSWNDRGPLSPAHEQQSNESRSKKSQNRQLLSCTKCRERKVKCDRVEPCGACCARGQTSECKFIVGEGNDYIPIPQSYEIKRLRVENHKLRERLQALRQAQSDDDGDDDPSIDRKSTRSGPRTSGSRQRGFRTADRIDNLYFGTPGLTSIVYDFANLQMGAQSLTHTVPRGKDFYAADSPAYPFPAISNCSGSVALLKLLPPKDKLFLYIDTFHDRAQTCSFQPPPEEVTKKEVERFLSDAERNAQRAPDMLALIFATLATGLQMGQWDQNVERWNPISAEDNRRDGDAFLAASMQSLRNASFLNTPSLLGIQTLIMMGTYLTNSGRFLDAWTLFGTTIRLAHSIGLHRNPRFLDPVPSLPECAARQALWWWMLHLDQQYSVTLGRPLGISGFGDCQPPQQLTTNPTMLRVSGFIDQFTILSRQILGSDGMMNIAKIDEFTDKILALWEKMPNTLKFNERWITDDVALPEWPLEALSTTLFVKMHSILVLLNRQRIEHVQNSELNGGTPPPGLLASHRAQTSHTAFNRNTRGRALVIHSSVSIIQAFLFFRQRNPSMLICWSLGQQAFNACMILLLDAWESEDMRHEFLIGQGYAVFRELENNGVHDLAGLAVERISEGLLKLAQRQEQRLQQASMSRSHSQQQSSIVSETTPVSDWSVDTVMGNTGMFLLEDSGLQSLAPQTFQTFSWDMAGSAPEGLVKQRSASMPSPTVQMNGLVVTPYSMGSASMVSSPVNMSTPQSAYVMAQQQRMQPSIRRPQMNRRVMTPTTFTAINEQSPVQTFSQPRTAQAYASGPRSMHRLDKPPRSSQRRR